MVVITAGTYWQQHMTLERMLESSVCNKFSISGRIGLYIALFGIQANSCVEGTHTRSVRKVSDRIFLCEHLMDYNLARLHEPTLNLSAHA